MDTKPNRTAVVRITQRDLLAPRGSLYEVAPIFARMAVRPIRFCDEWTRPIPDQNAVDVFLKGDGLPWGCQGDGYRRLTLRELQRGLDDTTAMILGIPADL